MFAGTINGSGALEVRSTREAGDTTIARIIRLVEEAQARRSPSERWVDRFARVYTPVVIVLALSVFLIPPIVTGAALYWRSAMIVKRGPHAAQLVNAYPYRRFDGSAISRRHSGHVERSFSSPVPGGASVWISVMTKVVVRSGATRLTC